LGKKSLSLHLLNVRPGRKGGGERGYASIGEKGFPEIPAQKGKKRGVLNPQRELLCQEKGAGRLQREGGGMLPSERKGSHS